MLTILFFLIAAVSATPSIVYTRTSATTLTSTLTTTSSSVVGLIFGYRTDALADHISDGIICSLAAGNTSSCTQFSCTTTTSCTLGSTSPTATDAFSTITVTQTQLIAARDIGKGTAIDAAIVYVSYAEYTSGFSVTTATITSATLSDMSSTIYTEVAPTFGLTFSRPAQGTLGTTIVPAAGQTVMLGWKASALAPVPADGFICTLAASGSCVEFTCSYDAATAVQTCMAPTTSILTSNAVTSASAIVVRNLAGGTFSPVVNPMHLAYVSVQTAASPYTPASAVNQAWNEYSAPLPTFNVNPTFTVTITRPQDAILGVSIVPPTNKTVFFGWRTDESVTWPSDAVICAGPVATCLDITCSAANTCVTRPVTIYKENAVTPTSIKLSRELAAGIVPLTINKKMWLAYDTADTAAGTTTLNASAAQSRSWSFYSADVPATSNAFVYIPSFFLALAVVFQLL